LREDDSTENEQVGEASGLPAAARCESCGGLPVWESICDGWGERWLASCVCGRVATFFPDRRNPDEQPPDPLVTFLQGHRRPRRPPTPPWVRLFLNSMLEPYSVRWRYGLEPCAGCESSASFGMLAWPRPYVAGVCTVCLQCGYVTASYSNPSAGTEERTLEGSAWAPACPAVQRLRECVYRSLHLAVQGEQVDG
jgi:hypothetical protein